MWIEAGDYVKLRLREKPFDHQDPQWWWRVTSVTDHCLDACYERRFEDPPRTEVRARRLGVSFGDVQAHRRPS